MTIESGEVDPRVRLMKIRALTTAANEGEAAAARNVLERLMASAGITESDLDDFISTYSAPYAIAEEDTVNDFGLYIDGRQTRRLLYNCVAYVIGYERWSNMRITRRHRKYIFYGLKISETVYLREVFMVHAKGLEAAQRAQRVDKETLKIRGRDSRTDHEIRALQDAITLAYINKNELFAKDMPEEKCRPLSGDELRRIIQMMRGMNRVDTPAPYERRIGNDVKQLKGGRK